MNLYSKYFLEARSGCYVLPDPDQLMAVISPTKDNLTSSQPSSFSLSLPTIIILLTQIYQENTARRETAPHPSKTTQHQSSLGYALA